MSEAARKSTPAQGPPAKHSNPSAPQVQASGPAQGTPTLGAPVMPVQFQLMADNTPTQMDCACGGSGGACGCGGAAPEPEDDLPGPGGFQLDSASAATAAPTSAHSIAKSGVSGASDPLPHGDRIQSAFGHHDVSSVRTRTGGRAAKANQSLGSNAYARQNDIAFRAAPSLHLAAHEAAHTVQQKRGVKLKGGIGRKGDPYEQQADAVADAVVEGGSAEALLDQDPVAQGTPSGPGVQQDCGCGGTCSSCQSEQGDSDALQMDLSVTPMPGSEEVSDAEAEEEALDENESVVPEGADAGSAADEIKEADENTENEAEEVDEPTADAGGSADTADTPAEPGAAQSTTASTAVSEEDGTAPPARDANETAGTGDADVLQQDGCGPTTEPAEEEEPAEPPPGEVQEEAEASGPSPADENEDPDAVRSQLEETEAGGAAEDAVAEVENADPGAADAALAEQQGEESGGAPQIDPAVAAGADMSAEMGQVDGSRAASVAGFAMAQAGLAEARGGAAGLAGLSTSFGGDANTGREDLQTASARLQGLLGRASGSIVAESVAIEAAIINQTQSALQSATAAVSATTMTAQMAVAQSVGGAKARVSADAAAQRAVIEAQAAATTAAVEAQSTAAIARLAAAETGAVANIATAQAAQIAPITAAHATGAQQTRAAGTEVGAEAMEIANRYKTAYESDRKVSGGECIEDSWYDGCLCDRRARARMTAAQQVGEGYRDSLIQAANEQAEGMSEGLATDFTNVAAMADAARSVATTQATATRTAIENRRDAAIAAIAASRTSAIGQITATETSTIANLDAHLAAQTQSLAELGFIQIATLEETAHTAAAAALGAVSTAIQSATTGVAMAVSGLTSGPPPAEDNLAAALAGIEGLLNDALSSLAASNQVALAGVSTRMAEGTVTAQTALIEAKDNAVEQATQMAATASTAVTTTASMTTTAMLEAMTSLITDTNAMAGAAETTMQTIVTGLQTNYTTFVANLATRFTAAAESLKDGLREALDGMHTGENAIPAKAREAASKEKPAWQSVLKWVLIIAIIIVVAVFAGPAVIGAIGGIAAGMGASAGAAAFIGATVGGALLGAATGATMQIVNNAFDGNPWHQGVGKAIVTGLITGALGGAVGFGIGAAFQGAAQGAQVATRSLGSRALEFGANLAADAGMEIGQQLIETGGVDWGNFGVAMAMSVGTAGLGEIPRVKSIQGAITEGVENSVTSAVRSARGADVDVDVNVRPDTDIDVDVGPRIEAEVDANPRAAVEDGSAPRAGDADAGSGNAPRAPDADADARARGADADDAGNPRVQEDGAIRDGDLSDVSARAANEPDAPRLEADPDTPARERSDAELAEAAQPVRLDGEDHTLVPRQWIDGEVRLFLCSDCGPVLNQLDAVSSRSLDADTRAQVEALRAEVNDIEASIKNGADTADMRTRLEEIAADVNRIDASSRSDADADATAPRPADEPADPFEGSPITREDYDNYVAEKQANGETPRTPEDYVKFRENFVRGSEAHAREVEAKVSELSENPDLTVVEDRGLYAADGETLSRPDIMAIDQSNSSVTFHEVKTGQAGLTGNQTKLKADLDNATLSPALARSLGLDADTPLSQLFPGGRDWAEVRGPGYKDTDTDVDP